MIHEYIRYGESCQMIEHEDDMDKVVIHVHSSSGGKTLRQIVVKTRQGDFFVYQHEKHVDCDVHVG